jgi:hypothetical protein
MFDLMKVDHVILMDTGLMTIWDKPMYRKYYVLDNGDIYEGSIEMNFEVPIEVYEKVSENSVAYKNIMKKINTE